MRYVKMLGLLAIAAAALMAFAGSASATVTSPAGTAYSGKIAASSTNSELDGPITVACSNSTVEGNTTSSGATSGTVTSLTFSNCGATTVDVIGSKTQPDHGGTLEVTNSGTVRSTGAKITVLTHSFFLGTTHCSYETNGTTVGTLTEGVAPAVMHIGSATIPVVKTDPLCGETGDAEWTGDYTVTTPSGAIIVD